eukprot:11015690-Prorocentrum_lima.AAC.1
MTSSLVGSEMCIRDSPRFLCSRQPVHPAAIGGPVPHSSRGQVQCTPAVSYTHLTLPTICSV